MPSSVLTTPISSSPSFLYHKEKIKRNTTNFHRSIWGDQFLTYNKRGDQAHEEQLAKQLKEEVRKKLVITRETDHVQHVELIRLIDAIQRLGVAYHFEDEIEECLKHIYVTYGDQWVHNDNLQSTSIWFRLLRQQGFNVSSGIFNRYQNDDGKFTEFVKDDVHGMLYLYEAAYMRTKGEQVLDEALEFTSFHLCNIAKNHNDTSLEAQIHQALQQPLRRRLPRLEALRYMPIYQEDAFHNEALLKLAKIDFNLLQDLHRKELSEISTWWKDLDVSRKLPYVRDRIPEGFLWTLAAFFEPQHSDARIFVMKSCNLVIILDDTYDNYGTYEELEIFTEAIQRWSIGCLDMLPEYMKVIYQELLNIHNEAEQFLEKKGQAYRSHYAVEMVKEYTRNLLIEAKWANEEYIPTIEEYKSVGLKTGGYPMMITKCYVHGWDDLVTEDMFKWVTAYPPLVKALGWIMRVMDDLATHKEEQQRNHVASSVECYMKQYNVSEEKAHKVLLKQVEDEWKVINEECLRPTNVQRPLLMPPINLARACDIIFKPGDSNYNNAGEEMISYIKYLLINPITL